MEVKRGGKKKKKQKTQEKARLWRKENENTELSRKSKKMEKNHWKTKGRLSYGGTEKLKKRMELR